MERTYTPEQMAQIVNDYERLKTAHRTSQQNYYAKKSTERKAYASAYYQRNKERILGRLAQMRTPPVPTEWKGTPNKYFSRIVSFPAKIFSSQSVETA